MADPLVVVNFKTYESAKGDAAVSLAQAMWEAHDVTGGRFVAAVSAFDLGAVHAAVPRLPVWAQHLDVVEGSSRTGWLDASTATARGARGTLLNHAEHRVTIDVLEQTIDHLPATLEVCACAASTRESRAIGRFKPTYVAVEPPELIGGDISVTSADPQLIEGAVSAVREVAPNVGVLCGAGVKTGTDVAAAMDLGAGGVLLASGVARSSDPLGTLMELVAHV